MDNSNANNGSMATSIFSAQQQHQSEDEPPSTQQQQTIPMQNIPAVPSASSNVLDIGLVREFHLMELQNIQTLIAHKQHELNVYTNARQLIETRDPGERCLVFLTDNLFVLRTREQALAILHRQIHFFEQALHNFGLERKALEERVNLLERLNISDEGLVDIREPVEEDKYARKSEKRIAHTTNNKKEVDEQKKTKEQQLPPRPKGVSDEDYKKFVDLVDSLNLSSDEEEGEEENEEEAENADEQAVESDEDDVEEEEETMEKDVDMEEDENGNGKNKEGKKQMEKHVHFSLLEDDVKPNETTSKSILKNKNVQSPIDKAEMQKMEKRDHRQVVRASKETVKDHVVERKGEPNRKAKGAPMPNKRQKDKKRPVSRWKAKRMGLIESDEEDQG